MTTTTTTTADSCFDVKIKDRTFNISISGSPRKTIIITDCQLCTSSSIELNHVRGKRFYGTAGNQFIGGDVLVEKLTDLSANKLNSGIEFDFKMSENNQLYQLSLIMNLKEPLSNANYLSYEFTFSSCINKDILAKRIERLVGLLEKQSKEIATLTDKVAELEIRK